MTAKPKGDGAFILLIIVFWSAWVWLYSFLIGGEALWKCLVATPLVPLPLMVTALTLRRVRGRLADDRNNRDRQGVRRR